MTTLKPHQIIEKFPLFEEPLATFIHENGEDNIFPAGEIMMKPGRFIKYAMLIVSGSVKLYREGADGEEFFMYFIEPGEACALSMMCMVRNQASTVMALAVESTTVIMIPIHHLDVLMKYYSSWYQFVMETYRKRFEDLLLVVDQITFKNMDERLEWYLNRQAASIGKELNLTHQQIAKDVNSSREVVSRLLKKMEIKGKIVMERNTIHWKS